MEQTTFFEHYRIRTDESDSPTEVSRTGAAINYQATDTRSKDSVVLQLIPLAAIDPQKREQFEEWARTAEKLDHINIAKVLAVGIEHDYLGLVSEQVEGETAEAWVVGHGPMASDAVLRIGLQVVRAIGAAAFFGLTHRALQPSNIMIVPGLSPDGGWPFVKLLNFGLAGVELHSESDVAREIAPSTAPQFASPEQLLHREIDFRSEIYSLGATMCFLLTGAAPLAVGKIRARWSLRRLPEFRRAHSALRNLLTSMLRQNPEDRPQDPVALEGLMRDCLTKIERRAAFRRKLGIPLAAVIPKNEKSAPTVFGQICRGTVAAIILLLAATALAAYLFPGFVPFRHRSEKIGVPIGVAESSPSPDQHANPPMLAANQSTSKSLSEPSPAQSSDVQSAVPTPTSAPVAIAGTASSGAQSPAAPDTAAAGPSNQPNVDEKSTHAQPSTETSHSATVSKQKPIASDWQRKSTSVRQARARAEEDEVLARAARRWARARFIGTTQDGRLILRLPSGRTVFVRPRFDDQEDSFAPPPPRRRAFIDQSDGVELQPFNPPGYPSDD